MGSFRKISAAGTSTTTGSVHPNNVTLGVPTFNRQTQELTLPWAMPSAPQPTKLLVLGEFPTQANALSADGTQAADGTRPAVGTPQRTDLGVHSAADDTYPIRITLPTPVTAEMVARIFVVSANDEVTNDLDGSPSVSLTVGPPDAIKIGSGVEYGPLVQDLRGVGGNTGIPGLYVEQVGANWKWWFELQWQIPIRDPRIARVASWNVVLFDSSIRTRRDRSRYSLVSSEPVTRDNYTLPDVWEIPDDPTTYRLYLQTKDVDGNLNQIVPAVTPYVEFTPVKGGGGTGTEFAGLIAGLHVSPAEYVKNGQGLLTLRIVLSWVNPSDPRYGGCRARVWTPGETAPGREASGLETGTSLTLEFTDFPSSTQLWHFAVLSVDQNNLENAYVDGVTPTISISVSPPTTGALPLVTSPSVTRTYSTNVDGVEQFVMSGYASPPSATAYPEFAGCKVVARDTLDADPINRDHVLAYTGTNCEFRTEPLPIGSPTVFDVYFVSVDVNGKENELIPGITPRVTGITVAAQTTGSLRATRLDELSEEFKVEDGMQTINYLKVEKLLGALAKFGGTTIGSAATPTGITQANPAVVTRVDHKLQTGVYVKFSGGTGSWAAINGKILQVTKITENTFSVPVNSTGFGAPNVGITYLLMAAGQVGIYDAADNQVGLIGKIYKGTGDAADPANYWYGIRLQGANPLSPQIFIIPDAAGIAKILMLSAGYEGTLQDGEWVLEDVGSGYPAGPRRTHIFPGGASFLGGIASPKHVEIDPSFGTVDAWGGFMVNGTPVVGDRQTDPGAASVAGISGVTGTLGPTYTASEQFLLQSIINTSLPIFSALVSLESKLNGIRSALIAHGLI